MTDTCTPVRSREAADGILDALENFHSQTHAIIQLLQLIGDWNEFDRLKGAVDFLHDALMERHNAATKLIEQVYAVKARGCAESAEQSSNGDGT